MWFRGKTGCFDHPSPVRDNLIKHRNTKTFAFEQKHSVFFQNAIF